MALFICGNIIKAKRQMKTNNLNFKSTIIQLSFSTVFIVLILLLTLVSFKNSNPEYVKKVVEKHDYAKFIVIMAGINLEEKEMVEMTTKSISTNNNKALESLGKQDRYKQYSIPASVSFSEEDLNKEGIDKIGADFDKEYRDRLVARHKDSMNKFEKLIRKF